MNQRLDAARAAVKARLERRPRSRWRSIANVDDAEAGYSSLVEMTVMNVLEAEERDAAVVALLRASESRQHSYDAAVDLAKYWAGSLPADVRARLLPEGVLQEVTGDVLDEPPPAPLLTFLREVARGERTRPKRRRGRSPYEHLLRDKEVAELVLIAGRVGRLDAMRRDRAPKRNSACDVVAECLQGGYNFDRVKSIWKKHMRWRQSLARGAGSQ
jgi:hypothetical protein